MKSKATRRLCWQIINTLVEGEKSFSAGRRSFNVEVLRDALARSGVVDLSAIEDEHQRRCDEKRNRDPERARNIRDKALRAGGSPRVSGPRAAEWVIEQLSGWNPKGGWHVHEYALYHYNVAPGSRSAIVARLHSFRENEGDDGDKFRVSLRPGSRPLLP